MKLVHSILLIILLSPCLLGAEGSLTVAGWNYALEQAGASESVPPDKGWSPITVPGMIKTGCRTPGAICYAWFRGEFTVSGDPAGYYGISLGRTFHTDRVFINGAFVDSQMPEDFANIHFPSSYVIPAGAVKTGKNTLLVRLGIYGGEWGGLLDEVHIHPKREYLKEKMFYETAFDKVPLGIAITLTAFMIVILVFYFWNRKNSLFLYGALITLAMVLYIVVLFSPHALLVIPFDWIFIVHWLLYPLLAMLVIIFIQSLYRRYFFFQNISIGVLFSVVSAIIIISHALRHQFLIRPACAVITEIIFVGYAVYLLKNMPRNHEDRYKFNRIVLLIILSQIAAAWDIAVYCAGGRTMLLVPALGALVINLIIIVLGGRDIYNRLRSMQHLYDSLKSRIDKKPLSITDESEEKLKRVIDFIKENYRSDISREGLSEAVGMNPDYMSKLFKTYTGMKINEYINKLRIEAAAGHLASENAKIIDIAFSVGFDNIVSFNRSFKAIMDLTPSEYRVKFKSDS
ncbi:MAG: helix-turn-helix transcriptional regulator [Spirochaetes bacterium]|nr:helix-turn-helix transcriptional regulator [Spirochaetota bacterium]